MKRLIAFFMLLIIVYAFPKTIHITADYVEPTDTLITYKGNIQVIIEEDNIVLISESMLIKKQENKWKLLEASTNVTFTFENGKVQGNELVYNIDSKAGNIKNASITINDSKSEDIIKIQCQVLNFDLKNDKFSGEDSDGVQIEKGKIRANAKKFVYDRKNGKIILEGNVKLKDQEKDITLTASKIIINTENNNMKGENVTVEIVVK
ncbi:hypothetical protein JYK00_06585 [Thermosipho ferrireducens]|uniref:Organic solvent tolerance-like N-terminal domain-containing protein n=1 Tax=Thermosipho ferrireducens TaxID=2571116 RepID=A0ABX7S6E7_9BACT|nr:LptA/OstA family protein [Thermosipho ferrireducens]QTA37401.1 hypothetical protein JYK00_06585 [Thermosipho ferrireducens]